MPRYADESPRERDRKRSRGAKDQTRARKQDRTVKHALQGRGPLPVPAAELRRLH